MKTFTFPAAGPDRFWLVKHQPDKTKVLRIELRQKVYPDKAVVPSLSSLVGWTNSDATDVAVTKACQDLKNRAGRALEFLGVHSG